jgi:hypothetical protein
MLRRFLTAVLLAASADAAFSNTFTVTSTTDSGAGSLRQAINDANANPGADTIEFNIVASGVQTIAPATSLPPITEAVTIDGYTQPGSSPNTHPVSQGLDTILRIAVDGSAAPGRGLEVRATDVTIRGLAIHGFSQGQIYGDGASFTRT